MAMRFIASIVATGGGLPNFTNIPQNFTHLQIRCYSRGTRSGFAAGDVSYIRFNGDVANNYNSHWLSGNGSAATSSFNSNTNFMYLVDNAIPDGSTLANVFGIQILDILDYSNTNKNTTVRLLSGWDASGSGVVSLASGAWRNTAAVTSIQGVFPASSNPAAGSRYDLYGISTSGTTGA